MLQSLLECLLTVSGSFVGSCFETGVGVPQSYDDVVNWLLIKDMQVRNAIWATAVNMVKELPSHFSRQPNTSNWLQIKEMHIHNTICYENGIGVTKSLDDALKYCQLAVEEEHEPAHFHIRKLKKKCGIFNITCGC